MPADSTAVLKDSKLGRTGNYNVQLDYTTPLGKAGHLETGYRSQISVTDNREWDYNLDKTSGEYDPDYSLINFFKSTSQVHAAYITYRQQIKTFAFQLGIKGRTRQVQCPSSKFRFDGAAGRATNNGKIPGGYIPVCCSQNGWMAAGRSS